MRNRRLKEFVQRCVVVTLAGLFVLPPACWAGKIARPGPSTRLSVPTIAVLGPDQLTLRVLSGPGFFGAAITRKNLPYFLDMTSQIQRAHPATKGNILFARFGNRAAVFPYSQRIRAIRKIGDIPDIHDISESYRFRTRDVAQALSGHLASHLKKGDVMEAHRASGMAFDNALPGAPLTLASTSLSGNSKTPRLAELELKLSLIHREVHHAAFRMFKPEYAVPLRPRATERFLRLIGADSPRWRDQGQFFTAAARAVRRTLVDYARRGQPAELVERSEFSSDDLRHVLAIDEALTRLTKFARQNARVAELRIFAGLSSPETAEAIDMDVVAARGNWTVARAWLLQELERGEPAKSHD